MTALVEIRCKLGSVQKRVADSASLTTCMADAQTIRSVKIVRYLDQRPLHKTSFFDQHYS